MDITTMAGSSWVGCRIKLSWMLVWKPTVGMSEGKAKKTYLWREKNGMGYLGGWLNWQKVRWGMNKELWCIYTDGFACRLIKMRQTLLVPHFTIMYRDVYKWRFLQIPGKIDLTMIIYRLTVTIVNSAFMYKNGLSYKLQFLICWFQWR